MRIIRKRPNYVPKTREHSTENKLVLLGFNVTIAFILSWGPYAIITLFAISGFLKEDNSLLVIAIPSFFAKSFTLYNPIIYIFNYPKFRKEFYQMIGCETNER